MFENLLNQILNLHTLYIFLFCYLLGSIPFGLILTKIFFNIDIRSIGSGNTGATNVLRTGNRSLAIITLILDAGKGSASALIGLIYLPDFAIFLGFLAFTGHLFPILLKFKGGKGVATFLGIFIVLSPYSAIIFIALWITVFKTYRYSSLSSILASLSIPLSIVLMHLYKLYSYKEIYVFMIFSIFMAIILIYRHYDNIIRLLNKKENKFNKQ
ncbi:MAG: glycerol-3-phosphate 1-O-acyltransferase PlsY [Alphaproteobacteria bacterium]|jgi:glycerol-3-phosphate acyltransferase PlsY